MQLCKDCLHYQIQTGYCLNTRRPDPVTGEPKYFYARIEREYQTANGCGINAKWFEPYPNPQYSPEDLDDLSTIPFGR